MSYRDAYAAAEAFGDDPNADEVPLMSNYESLDELEREREKDLRARR